MREFNQALIVIVDIDITSLSHSSISNEPIQVTSGIIKTTVKVLIVTVYVPTPLAI
jgi:hypothetical protein